MTDGTQQRLRVLVVGVGKMGLSHLAILRAHPQVEIVGVCDSSRYVLDVLNKYSGLPTYSDYGRMVDSVAADAAVIATPTRTHYDLAMTALKAGHHVFCEKPLALSVEQSAALTAEAAARGLVGQVGYHNRFVGSFQEVKKLLESGAIGPVSHALVEAYGPVVLRSKGSTWRSRKKEGGGALYDYAAHPLDLACWYFGEPTGVEGATLGRIHSAETEDEVYCSIDFEGGTSAQLSVNWSDESYRKMTTRVTLWGRDGKIEADRQECRTFLRSNATAPSGYHEGWNIRYTTDLTKPVGFYLRGEEYSAQIDSFIRAAAASLAGATLPTVNDFRSGLATDRAIAMIIDDAAERKAPSPALSAAGEPRMKTSERRRFRWGWRRRA